MPEGNKNFEIVRASAGSGKTFKLVLTYLECALRYDDPRYFRRILALTFTNKAAYEMKSRVLEDLNALVEGKSDKLEALKDALGESPEEITRRAAQVQQTMLHNYSDISIMTIDKFINRLVKSFARDLAIDQDYRVELDSDSVVSEAVTQLLNKVGEKENKKLTQLLMRFTEQQIFEDKNAAVREPLVSLGKNLMKESMKALVKSLTDLDPSEFHEIRAKLSAEIETSKKRLKVASKKLLADIEELKIPYSEFGSKGGILPSIDQMTSGDPKEKSNKTLITKLIDPTKLVLTAHQSKRSDNLSALAPQCSEVLEAMLAMGPDHEGCVTEEAKEFKLKKSLAKRIGLLGTLAGLVKEVEQVQIDKNVRTFDAMHASIAEIVRNNPAPFIYERLGERYNHIFIDEFQDTSVTQWLNLLVLYDHAMSKNGKTLVVGDGKQAIYRFRNGDYKQLMDLPNVYAEEAGESLEDAKETLIREQSHKSLTSNWRSGFDIVEWNNNVFESLKKFLPKGLEKVYYKHDQKAKKEFPGAVYVDTFLGGNKQSRIELYCDKVVERVKAYKKEGFEYGDITVLVSQNVEGALISQKLLENDIKPMTEESLQLGRHPGPLVIIALLKWILRPNDYRQSAAIVQCLAALNSNFGPSINEADVLAEYIDFDTETKKRFFKTEKMLAELVPDLDIKANATAPLVPLIGYLCRAFRITSHFPAYAEGMLELAREVGGSDEGVRKALLNLWDKTGRNRSVITSKTKDSVQIMTVHKAKGLAFKVVIFMLDNKSFSDNKNHIPVHLGENSIGDLTDVIFDPNDFKNTSVEYQKDAEDGRIRLDDINKVYVALTRPVERLDVLIGLVKEDVDPGKIGSVSEILYHSINDMCEGKFEPGYQTSSQQEPQTEPINDVQYTQPKEMFTGEDVRTIVVAPPAESLTLSPSRLNARELGSAVHSVVERINSLDDWPLIKLALEHSQSYDAEDRATIIERVQTIIDSPQLRPHFDPSAHIESERAFLASDGTIARPDRLTMTATHGWTVIDYKASKQKHNDHVQQLLTYVEMISEIEGSTASGMLVYTDPFEIVKVN